jgi:hypothetical protein
MDIEKEADVTDDYTRDDIESDAILTPASSSPMIGSITDEGDWNYNSIPWNLFWLD